MNLKIAAAILLVALASGSFAATPLRLNGTADVSLSEGCTSVACSESFYINSSFSSESTLSPGEAAGFNANSVVKINDNIIGERSFRVGDAANYREGDTSLVYTGEVAGPSASLLNLRVQMSWAGGKLTVNHSLKGKGLIVQAHPTVISAFNGKKEKSHRIPMIPYQIVAENEGTSFMSIFAGMTGDLRRFTRVDIKAAGEAVETMGLKFKVKDFELP